MIPDLKGKRLSPRGFKDQLEQLGASLRAAIDANVDGFPADEAERHARRARALSPEGFRFFCETYFPHYLTKPPSRLHLHLFEDLPAMLTQDAAAGRKGHRKARIAPRGAAKSTIATQLFTLWCALRGQKRFIIIGMDTYEQAALMVEAIKVEIESNPRLAYDYPDFSGAGRRWREGEIVTRNRVMILGAGARQALRGKRFGPHRPDLVILDDIENDVNVESPQYRNKLQNWVEKAVLKLGPADGSLDVVMLGTVLHYDAVLVRLSRQPGWEARHFRAVERFPDRMDLWDRWQEHFLNEGEEQAHQFYDAHRTQMDEGAVVNWPEVEPLYTLMVERASSETAFMSEKQGEPISEESPFRQIIFWVQKQPGLVYFGAVDPSLGRHGANRDPSAIIVGGLDPKTGVLDVVEASICRRLPDVIIADVIAMAKRWRPALWFVEAVQFQEFLRTEIMKAAVKQEVPLPAIPVLPIADKGLRIQRLQPPMAAGLIRLHSSQTSLLEQLRQWPSGAHDDGPDCLEMLWSGAVSHGGALGGAGMSIRSAGRRGRATDGWRI
jgi:predicted phage terminase large subunit-like protein